MRLILELNFQWLRMRAYSSEVDELARVSSALTVFGITYRVRFDTRPEDFKMAEFHIHGIENIHELSKRVHMRLTGSGTNTVVTLLKTGNKPYKCEKLKRYADKYECVTIYADNDHEAFLQCAILAGKKNWLGGDESAGSCDQS